MPLTARWDNEEKTSILVTFESPWEWDEVVTLSKQVNELIDQVDYPVYLIHDATKSLKYPSSNILAGFKRGVDILKNDRVKKHIAVGTIELTQIFVPILMRIMRVTFDFADSLEEARQQIRV